MRVGSVCSGVGCIDLGLERAGHSVIWQVEIDEKCRSVLRRHWPESEIREDLSNVDSSSLASIDLLVGGTPCQDFSVAGRGEGLAGERSGLFVSFIRLADELAPGWILWENVPGALSTNGGNDFAVCLEGFTGFRPEVPEDGWRNSGICSGPIRNAYWRVLDAQNFGVPQRRRRVFVAASPREICQPEVLFEPESVYRDTAPRKKAWSKAATLTAGCAGNGRRQEDDENIVSFTCSRPAGYDEGVGTLRAPGGDCSGGSESLLVADPIGANEGRTYCNAGNNPRLHNVVGIPPRRLTPRECERLQGLPDDWTRYGHDGAEMSDAARYRMIGNGAAVPVLEWIGRRMTLGVQA